MDFMVGIHSTRKGFDSIWVIVDRLTNSAHFIPIKISYTAAKLAYVYTDRIVSLHGVPMSIVSDRGSVIKSRFWGCLQEAMGTRLDFSTAFHLQKDGQSERIIQTLEDMVRLCVLDFKGSWDVYLPLVEFLYNNNYHSSVEMAPYEALYGAKCRSPICWEDVGDRKLTGAEIIQSASEKVSPMQGVIRFGKRGKLSLSYVRPYENYIIDPSQVIQTQAMEVNEELSYEEKPVELVDTQLRKLRTKEIPTEKVLWRNHSLEEYTWETEADMHQRFSQANHPPKSWLSVSWVCLNGAGNKSLNVKFWVASIVIMSSFIYLLFLMSWSRSSFKLSFSIEKLLLKPFVQNGPSCLG
ncbi:uncharacterized protein LOC126657050 [Mercurialis annua]|uniref:uncharacterized protein LOC126657050 n=1 Tax=Mercurialis annua TaxID=3986 RepID=UPI00215FCB62|nr:uncharacterized protein LOC126657050 [Mercurialis annua]